MSDNFQRMERTNILPLRWLANFVDMPASWLLRRSLRKYFKSDEPENFDSWEARISQFLYDRFVFRWGTYYRFNRPEKTHACPGFQDTLGFPRIR